MPTPEVCKHERERVAAFCLNRGASRAVLAARPHEARGRAKPILFPEARSDVVLVPGSDQPSTADPEG